MKYEYHEGVEATDRFKHGMKKLFQVPKQKLAKRQPKAPARKKSGKNKG